MLSRKPKLTPIKAGSVSVGDTVLALQSLNLPPVRGTVKRVDETIIGTIDKRTYQSILIDFPTGGGWFHLCNGLDCGVYLATT